MKVKLGSCIACSLLAGLKWFEHEGKRVAELPWDVEIETKDQTIKGKEGEFLIIDENKDVYVTGVYMEKESEIKERIHEDQNKSCNNCGKDSCRADREGLLPKLRQAKE